MQETKKYRDEKWLLTVVVETDLIVEEYFFLGGHFFSKAGEHVQTD